MRNVKCWKFLAAVLVASAALPARAEETAIEIAGGERNEVSYACDDGAAREVTYVNGAAQSFAVVPVDGAARIFVGIISGSGARYASGQFVWWTKGREATLYDLTRGEDGKPRATCHEAG